MRHPASLIWQDIAMSVEMHTTTIAPERVGAVVLIFRLFRPLSNAQLGE
jgi:hypothetical protein